ncbi:MAG: potassium-transporting ATPase subunit KdpC [Solirubrobacteraceae bacterium]|nr:potassium-transporting ATPase subunit KdpC [Solirubrobacteraceae bacterium]
MSASSATRQLLAGFRVLLILTLLVGVAYPLAITGVAQVVSPGNANGSRLEHRGAVIGSQLIAQPFEGEEWFQPRPSAAGEDGYDTLSSSASNLGPNSSDLVAAVKERRDGYVQANGVAPADVPVDAVTAGGSGLDPHISPANARHQVARVAAARSLPPTQVQQLVDDHTQGRTLGFLGDPRVNVLDLNLALERLRQ